jgi:hypothetical protein
MYSPTVSIGVPQLVAETAWESVMDALGSFEAD